VNALPYIAAGALLPLVWAATGFLVRAARRDRHCCVFCRVGAPIAGTDLCERCLAERLP